MLKNVNYSKILFFDIETVPQTFDYNELDEKGQGLWDRKTSFIQQREDLNAEEVYEKAGIYAEFGKVVCISLGFVLQKEGETQIRIKSIANEDEIVLLQEFLDLLNSYYNSPDFLFCAHNGKEFDIPFLCRRMVARIGRSVVPAHSRMAGSTAVGDRLCRRSPPTDLFRASIALECARTSCHLL